MRIIIIIIIISLWSCGNSNTSKIRQISENKDSLVVVFNNVVDSKVSGVSLLGSSLLTYIGSDGFPVFADEFVLKDTIKLPTTNDYLEVAVLSNQIQYQYFYLMGGDTINISYDKRGVAYATSKVSSNLTMMYNFVSSIKGSFNENGLSPKAMCLLFPKKMDSVQNYIYAPFIDEYSEELKRAIVAGKLDSVYRDYYNYQYRVSLRSYKYFEALVKNKINAPQISIKYANLDDSLSNLVSYYKEILPVYQVNGFDNILSNKSIPIKSKRLILYEMMRLWNMPGWLAKSQQELDNYYLKYSSITGDSATINKLKLQFNHSNDSETDTAGTLLNDINGNTIDLSEVLSRNLGKVIYVDFWASWCAPCIAGMDDALKLRREYNGKGVVFIYLALNDEITKWKDAIRDHKMDILGENYFIINTDNSRFINQFNITAIPRFIIFDKTGKIATSNAPRPESNDVRVLLDKYL